MGYDIHVACQYTDHNGRVCIGEDYQIIHYIGDREPQLEVKDPIFAYRNYNLFRPLANIHNTQKNIDYEKQSWIEFSRTMYGDTAATNHTMRSLYPETDYPTDVIDAQLVDINNTKIEIHPIVKQWVFDCTNENVAYMITLGKLIEFGDKHPQYLMLGEFIKNAIYRYNKCNNAIASQCDEDEQLAKIGYNNFTIFYGFDY